jgi:hypothetical protein
MMLSLTDASVLPAVAGVEGVATKVFSGPGRVPASDDGSALPAGDGSVAVLQVETDGIVRQAIRGATGWFVSVPYTPPPQGARRGAQHRRSTRFAGVDSDAAMLSRAP